MMPTGGHISRGLLPGARDARLRAAARPLPLKRSNHARLRADAEPRVYSRTPRSGVQSCCSTRLGVDSAGLRDDDPRCQPDKERPVLILALLQLAATAAPAAAPVSAATVVEYLLPRPKAFPHDPAVGRDGIVWYTDQANSYIGRLDPATGQVTDYPTPTQASGPHGIIVAPDGGVWYTGNFKGRLGRLDPATGAIKEYMLPAEARDPHTPLYSGGKIWFTSQGADLYGALDPATGQAKLFPVPTPGARPYGLVAGPDGSIRMALVG